MLANAAGPGQSKVQASFRWPRARSRWQHELSVGRRKPMRARPGPGLALVALPATPKLNCMFTVDEPTAEAIRRAWHEGGELSAIVEFQRRFPLISDHAKARECVRIIAGWKPLPPARERQPG